MKPTVLHQEELTSDARCVGLVLDLSHGLRGISQSTLQKVTAELVPFDQAKGSFLLPDVVLECRLRGGPSLSGAEVHQLLQLSGGYVAVVFCEPVA